MNNSFHVEVRDFSTLQEIDGAWKTADFAALLDAMEFGDHSQLGDDEMREMCLMSLQDQEPEEAAYLVLKHVIGDDLREGQLRNMSNEMLNEKLWEEYVDPGFHERLFNVGSVLYAAIPSRFPKTDAVRVRLKVAAQDTTSREHLNPVPTEALLVRLLADGMEANAVLHRLYGEQLTGPVFPNADEIVWIVNANSDGDDVLMIEVISSGYWLDALEGTKSYNSTAYADEVAMEKE